MPADEAASTFALRPDVDFEHPLGPRERPVTESGLSANVQGFLSRCIDSLEQLEVLLLLLRTSPKQWTANEVANELRVAAPSVAQRLAALERRGLVSKEDPGYRYANQSAEDAVVREVAEAYRDRRVAVITYIFSKPASSIQALADAFKVK